MPAGLVEQWLTSSFCDAEIIAGGVTHRAHRCILASASAYFNALYKTELADADGPQSFDNVASDACAFALQFVYLGKCTLTKADDLVPVLEAAIRMHLEPLRDAAVHAITERLSVSSCTGAWILACKYNLAELERSAIDECGIHFETLKADAQLTALSADQIATLVAKDDLRAMDEASIFDAVQQWCAAQQPAPSDAAIARLIGLVRFRGIRDEAVARVIDHPLMQKIECARAAAMQLMVPEKAGDPRCCLDDFTCEGIYQTLWPEMWKKAMHYEARESCSSIAESYSQTVYYPRIAIGLRLLASYPLGLRGRAPGWCSTNGYSGSEFVSDMRACLGKGIEWYNIEDDDNDSEKESKARKAAVAEEEAEKFESLLETALLHDQVVSSDHEGVKRIVSLLDGDESDEASEDREGEADEEVGEEGGDGGDTGADDAEDDDAEDDDEGDDEEDWDEADDEEDASDDDEELIAELVDED